MGLWILGILLVGARVCWELADPIRMDDFKGIFYLRETVTLFPATCCWLAAVFRHRSGTGARARTLVTEAIHAHPRLSAALLATTLTFACLAISVFIFRTRACCTDEAAYLFQSKVFMSGRLCAAPPPINNMFFSLYSLTITPDKWYSRAFPMQSLVLAPATIVGLPFIVNPVLTGILLLLVVHVARRLFDETTAMLASVLMLISPFVLLQGASYLSHIVSAIFVLLGWFSVLAAARPNMNRAFVVGACAGMLLLTRPLTAVVLGGFAAIFWLIQYLGKQSSFRGLSKQYLSAIVGAVPGVFLLAMYDRSLTGHPLVTPFGLTGEDMSLGNMLRNTTINLGALSVLLLGVPLFSFVPLLVSLLHDNRKWLIPVLTFCSIYIISYGFFEGHGLFYGPRYYFEMVPILLIMSSWGILAMPALLSARFKLPIEIARERVWTICVAGTFIALVGLLAPRLWFYHKQATFYDVRHIVQQNVRTPALVLITDRDRHRVYPYLAAFQLNDIELKGPVIFARDRRKENKTLIAAYADRNVYVLRVEQRQIAPYDSTAR